MRKSGTFNKNSEPRSVSLSVYLSVALAVFQLRTDGRKGGQTRLSNYFLSTTRQHTKLLSLLRCPAPIFFMPIPVHTKQQEEKTFRTLTFLKPLAVHSLNYALLLNEFAVRIFLLAVSFIILLQGCRLSHFQRHDRITSARILWFLKEQKFLRNLSDELGMARHLPVMQ